MTADDSPKASKHGCHIISSVVAQRIRIRCNSPWLIEIAVLDTDTTTFRMNSLVKPWAPVNLITQRRHHLTDDMVDGAPTSRQILTDLIITDRRVILAYNSGSAFDTVIREVRRAGLGPENLEDRATGGASRRPDRTGSDTRITTSRSHRHPVRSASATPL